MTYTTTNGSSPSTHATMSLSGTTMSFDARNVNVSSLNSSYWSVTKTIQVNLTNNATAATYHTVAITVIPCELTVTTIPDMIISVGYRQSWTIAAETYAHSQNTSALCGAPVYEFTGGDTSYITWTLSTLTFDMFPLSTALEGAYRHEMRSYCANYPH
jgi:hypothetical protein